MTVLLTHWFIERSGDLAHPFVALGTMAAQTSRVLDIQTVGDQPDFGVASPLADTDLERVLGTSRPTREQIDAHRDQLQELRRRWQARIYCCDAYGLVIDRDIVG